jgi:hypothetical protein
MTVRPFIVSPEDYSDALDIVGEHVTVLASGKATEGYEIFLQRGSEGSGPPPHSHPWDESFFVVKGEIDFGIGAEQKTASTGTLVHLPAGTEHWFRFGRGGGESGPRKARRSWRSPWVEAGCFMKGVPHEVAAVSRSCSTCASGDR